MRLESKRVRARADRTRKAKSLYMEYSHTILPSEWFYLPTAEQAAELPWCKEIIERDISIPVIESDFDLPLTNLASSVEACVQQERDHLIALLPEDYRGALPPTPSMSPTTLTCPTVNDVRQGKSRGNLRPFLGPIELAMAVFKIPSIPTILVARDACHAMGVHPLEFSARGSEAVVHMLGLSGLDPKTSTADEFDTVDHRFLCLNCYRANNNSWAGGKAQNWRSAVRTSPLYACP